MLHEDYAATMICCTGSGAAMPKETMPCMLCFSNSPAVNVHDSALRTHAQTYTVFQAEAVTWPPLVREAARAKGLGFEALRPCNLGAGVTYNKDCIG